MDFLRQRQKTKRRLYSKATVIGLFVVLAFLMRPTWNIYQKSLESQRNLSRAQSELSQLDKHRKNLENDISYLKTDTGRDQEIRDKFGVTKEGETMVVIVRPEDAKKEVATPPPPTFFEKIRSGFLSFFGLK